MKLAFIKGPAIRKLIGRGTLALKRYLPEILTVMGIGTSVAATVTACKATTKLGPVLEEHKAAVDDIHAKTFKDPKEERKELAKVYVRTTGKLAKLYALPAALEGVSAACQIGSTHYLRKENKAIAAAYMGLLEAYRAQHPDIPKKNSAEGSEEGGKEEKDSVTTTNRLSPYAVMFDKHNSCWRRRASDNETFLLGQMNQLNDMLHAQGHLFLNEVLVPLGFPKTEAGQYVGWVDGMGDSFIDFCMIEGTDDDGDSVFWLDFNVDGSIMYIFDKMFEGKGKNVPFMIHNV